MWRSAAWTRRVLAAREILRVCRPSGRLVLLGAREVPVSDEDLSVPARRLFGTVLVGVCFGGFAGVMRRVEMMAVGRMRVMRRFFVRASVVMFRRLLVMACRVLVMLRRSPMMFC
jgi:hypothetical protein